jgi:cytosine/adenosine deaminase-related metal-dependent hydrolase
MQSDRLTIGLSPHAPYTVDLDGFKRCLSAAKEKHLPLATHLAETPEESEFLHNQLGPFRDVWEKLGLWDEGVVTYRDSPIRFADAIGLLEYPTLLAHVNYCSDEELALLARGNASVVYCPRTHRYFGHAPHRWREMIVHGINVAIGTDSCASSPDLNLLGDLRLMRELAPEVPVETLWKIATINGAMALMLEQQIGTLTVGKQADLVVYHTQSDEPLSEILDEGVGPDETWIDGSLLTPYPSGRGQG